MDKPAILTQRLTRTFGKIQAVSEMNLQVPRGRVFGFLGPNGAGKTTTLRLLLGLLEPTSGEASVLGFDIGQQAAEIRQRCGALLEHPGLYERLSAEDNLEFYGRVWRMPPDKRRQRIRFLLTQFGLWERRSDQVGSWSRGMKQKLAIARTLLHQPELVFLDEPTAGLDPVAAAALRDDLEGLVAQEGVTIFLTTHNLYEAERLCHQVGVIRSGVLLAVGRLDELRQAGTTPRLQVTGANFTVALIEGLRQHPLVSAVSTINGRLEIELRTAEPAYPLVSYLIQGGAQVEEVTRTAATLEDVFLALVNENGGKSSPGSASQEV